MDQAAWSDFVDALPYLFIGIPIAAVIGVPLYIRAEASLTELILLRALFTLKLLAAFLAVIFSMAMIAGYATYLFSDPRGIER